MIRVKTGLLTAALCTTLPALAQVYEPGIHGGINLPTGDLSDALDSSPGFTVGGHVGIYFGNGHEVRPRIDFTHYQGGYFPSGGGYEKNRIDAWSVGADYLYYLEQRPVGPYLTGGLAYQWWNVDAQKASDSNNSALGVALGGGYRFNRTFMLEGRFTTGQFRSDSGQANAFQALASMRF